MRRTSFADMPCSVARTLEVVGEWWSLLIVRDALLGIRRFDDFQARLGIARNVLSQRLATLVEQGVLEKVPYQQHPVRHEYRLTEKGRALWTVLDALRTWGDEWEPGPDGPPALLVHRGCGATTHVTRHCAACGDEVTARDLRLVRAPGVDSMVPEPRDREAAPR